MLTPELRSFKERLPETGHLQLLLGPVGAGKSLFCQRYYRYLATPDVRDATYWAFMDFNRAPDNLHNAERWICETFLRSFQEEHPGFDLYALETLHQIFAPDVNRVRKIYAKALGEGPELELKVADAIDAGTRDPIKFVRELCRFLNGDQRKVVVGVFDNVDKRDRNDQLRIFQLAQWFRTETRSFCLLPLRDETYEQFKTRPPLDTVLNAIHFSISPPRFIDVVKKRLELCIAHIAENAPDKLSYALPDGKRIVYPASKLGEFLKTLYIDIFRSGRRISWLLEALAGRNVRSSLEMFAQILMSGHLDERQITGTLLGTFSFTIRDATIINVLMKTDYLYFADLHGFITNVLSSDPSWRRQSNFLVFEALEYLVSKRKERSEIGAQGYVVVRAVLDHLNRMGFPPNDTIRALTTLLGRGLIVADHQGRNTLAPDDFVRAHASGFVHTRLLVSNIHYLAAIAPATYMNDRRTAERIGRMSTVNQGFTDIQFARKREVVFSILEYLKSEYERQATEAPLFAQYADASRYLLRMIQTSLDARSVGLDSHADVASLLDR